MSKKKKQPEQAPPSRKKRGGGITRFFLLLVVIGGLAGGAYLFMDSQSDPSVQLTVNFYNHLQSKNYEQAVAMFDQNMFKEYSKEEWIQKLKDKNEQAKGINSYKLNQVARLSDSQNKKTVIHSTIQYGDSTRYEQVHFLKIGEQYKILDYLMNRSKDEVDRESTLN